MKLKNMLLFSIMITLSSSALANTEVITRNIIEINNTPIASWWKYMTPIEKKNFLRRLKQGNRIKTFTKEEFKEVEDKRLLEWVEYRIKQDGGL